MCQKALRIPGAGGGSASPRRHGGLWNKAEEENRKSGIRNYGQQCDNFT